MNSPPCFRDLRPEERAALEMARRMGLTMQFWRIGVGWCDRTPGNHGTPFEANAAYRIKPND